MTNSEHQQLQDHLNCHGSLTIASLESEKALAFCESLLPEASIVLYDPFNSREYDDTSGAYLKLNTLEAARLLPASAFLVVFSPETLDECDKQCLEALIEEMHFPICLVTRKTMMCIARRTRWKAVESSSFQTTAYYDIDQDHLKMRPYLATMYS